jgi:hypothetical protein
VTTPYVAACAAIGAHPAHPEWWTTAQRAGYRAIQLARFRSRWRRLGATGYPALVRAQSGREALIHEVRLEVARALAPPPTQPWAHCACHRMRFVTNTMTKEPHEAIDDDDLALWRARDRAARQGIPRRAAVALAYIEQFRPRGGGHA